MRYAQAKCSTASECKSVSIDEWQRMSLRQQLSAGGLAARRPPMTTIRKLINGLLSIHRYTIYVMSIKIVRLGSPRRSDEGIRIGTVRRPPRGVAKADVARRDYYDVWLPTLSPTAELVSQARTAISVAEWERFVRRFKKEMNAPDASKVLDLLAALSRTANFAIGCYCEDESRCHRAVLRQMLEARGAVIK